LEKNKNKKKQKEKEEEEEEDKKKWEKKKKRTTQRFTVDLHSETLSNFSFFLIPKDKDEKKLKKKVSIHFILV
jgi:hypothetical protein